MSTLTNDPVREPFIFEAGSYSPRNILFPIKKNATLKVEEDKIEAAARADCDWTPAEERRLVRKYDLRIMTVTCMFYLLAYIDRGNLGNAKILRAGTPDNIQVALGLVGTQFNWIISITFFAVLGFQVPLTFLIKKLSGPVFLSIITVCWGIISMTGAACKNASGMYTMRFFLGVAEAGLIPGCVYYFSFFYTPTERAKRLGLFTSMSVWAGAFTGFIAIGVDEMNGTAGLASWQWLFILEGLPSVLFGIASYFILLHFPDSPRCQLSERERHIATKRLAANAPRSTDFTFDVKHAKRMLCRPSTYLFPVTYFCVNLTQAGIGSFLPSILTGIGFKTAREANGASAYISIWGGAYFILYCAHSDWTRERTYHGILSALCLGLPGAVMLVYNASNPNSLSYGVRYFAAFLLIVNGADQPVIQALRMNSVSGATETAIASATIFLGLTVSNIAGPQLYPNTDGPLYRTGLLISTITLGLAIIMYMFVPALLHAERRLLYGPNCLPWARKFQEAEPDHFIAPPDQVARASPDHKEKIDEIENEHVRV